MAKVDLKTVLLGSESVGMSFVGRDRGKPGLAGTPQICRTVLLNSTHCAGSTEGGGSRLCSLLDQSKIVELEAEPLARDNAPLAYTVSMIRDYMCQACLLLLL